ncbi:MAG: winged helix-turn-helix domain-containing protein [Candidatus Thermoplasmatota archaeon]|nr:winged helix-turn-helix domain-containing protein [Candidatus Thermoplasmatota archaeon]
MGRKDYTRYDEVGDLLKFITSSSVRTKMMIGLMDGPQPSGAMREAIGVSASTVIHAARDLEKEQLLEEWDDGYHLTALGRIVAGKLSDTIDTMAVLNKHRNFWLTHDVQAIPRPFLDRLGEIQSYDVVTSSVKDIFKTFGIFIDFATRAQQLRGVSPVFVDQFVTLIQKLLKRGADVQLVITGEVLGELKNKDRTGLRQTLGDSHLGMWVIDEPVRVAFTVTESMLSLGLFGMDGVYDVSHDLVSKHQGAINWGRELFEHYRSRARPLAVEDV